MSKRTQELINCAEEMMWGYLNNKTFRHKIQKTDPYILDFYCHSLTLVFEIDGSIHEPEEVVTMILKGSKYLKRMV